MAFPLHAEMCRITQVSARTTSQRTARRAFAAQTAAILARSPTVRGPAIQSRSPRANGSSEGCRW